jgi:hypothetical protein
MGLTRCLLAFAFTIGLLSTDHAQAQADFYKGKTVELMIGYSVGGGYDVYARLIARHLGKHIRGNPTVTPKNMDGAGSLRLANWLYNVASKEGLVLARLGAAPALIRCSAASRRSSTAPSSTGSAAPTTRSASASSGTAAARPASSRTC